MPILISSKWTVFYKNVFPVLYFGIFAVALCGITISIYSHSAHAPPPEIYAAPILAMGLGFLLVKKLIFPLMDEVYDCGDTLLAKKGKQEERIAFSDIMNVSYSVAQRPPSITLSLRRESVFGKKIMFLAPISMIPFKISPIVDTLIEKVDKARRNDSI